MQNSNVTTIIVAAIAALPPTLVAFLSLRAGNKNKQAIDQVHILINNRMTELLKTSIGEARLEGRAIERKEAGEIK